MLFLYILNMCTSVDSFNFYFLKKGVHGLFGVFGKIQYFQLRSLVTEVSVVVFSCFQIATDFETSEELLTMRMKLCLQTLLVEMVPFVCSGAHVIQKDCHPSALNTFIEAMSHCSPSIPIKP
jgi:hypothetical protein